VFFDASLPSFSVTTSTPPPLGQHLAQPLLQHPRLLITAWLTLAWWFWVESTPVCFFHFSDISSLSWWSFKSLEDLPSSFNTEVWAAHYLVHSQFCFQKEARHTTEDQQSVHFGNLGSSFIQPFLTAKFFIPYQSSAGKIQSIFLLLLLLQTSLHWPLSYKILSPLLLVLTTKFSSLIP